MKSKPNTDQFKPPKDPTAFLESGMADVAEKPPAASAVPPPSPVLEKAPARGRVQKIFNFSPELVDRLANKAAARSREKGSRVTEVQIVVEALEAYLKE